MPPEAVGIVVVGNCNVGDGVELDWFPFPLIPLFVPSGLFPEVPQDVFLWVRAPGLEAFCHTWDIVMPVNRWSATILHLEPAIASFPRV